MPRYAERVYHMRPDSVPVVCRIIPPFVEYLTGKAVPIAVEQRFSFGIRQRSQTCQILRVIAQKNLIVKYGGRHKNTLAYPRFQMSVRMSDLHRFRNGGHGRRRRDKTCLYPPVSDPSGICLRPYVATRPRTVWAVAGKQVTVFIPCKLCQLIKINEIIPLSLIIQPIFRMLHGTEPDARPGWEGPYPLGLVVFGTRICTGIQFTRTVDQFGKLRNGFSQNNRPVMRNMNLTQGFRQGAVRFSATGGTAIQCLFLRSCHK